MNKQPSTITFQERYASAGSRLTPSERKIGQYLMRHPDEVVSASALQLASATGTSDASVIRAVQRLGYTGMKELKQEFLEDILRRRSSSATLHHNINRMLTNEQPIQEMLSESVEVLDAFRLEFDADAFARSIDALAGARAIFAYGLGPGGMIAGFLALYLNRVGYDARPITQTGYRLADDLLPMKSSDCVVLFAPYHLTMEVEAIIDHAGDIGACVVLVTEALGHTLKDRVHAVIRTPSTISGLASESLAPLAVCHAITMQMAARDEKASIERSKLFNGLSSRFTGSLEMPSPPFVLGSTDEEEE